MDGHQRSSMTPQPQSSHPPSSTSHAAPPLDLGPSVMDEFPDRPVMEGSMLGRPPRSMSAPTRQRRGPAIRDEVQPIPPRRSARNTPNLLPVPDPEANVLRVAAQAFAKSSFFHASFTSSHGATMLRHTPRLLYTLAPHATGDSAAPHATQPPADATESQAGQPVQPYSDRALLLMPPSMRRKYQKGLPAKQRSATAALETNRVPRLAAIYRRPTSAEGRQRQGLTPTTLPSMHNSFTSHNASTTSPQMMYESSRATSLDARLPRGRRGREASPEANTPLSLATPRSYGSDGKASPRTVMVDVPPPTIAVNVEPDAEEDDDPVTWTQAATEIVPLAIPSIISMALTYGLTAIPLAFIGSHMGEDELTASSIGVFILSIVAQYPIFGLTFALDTLASHEFGRDPESDVLGLLLQRGILVNLSFAVPVCFLLNIYAEAVLSSIYGPLLGAIAGQFLRFVPLFLMPLVVFVAFSKFCSNQLLPQLPTIAMTCGLIVTPVAQRALIHLGVEGSMLGMAVASWTQLIVIVILTFSKKETLSTLGTLRIAEALDKDDVIAYLKLALPSAVFVAAEASAFDMSVLLAAKLGSAQGAAWSAILNCSLPFVSIAGGLSTAACAKVGASLGAGYPEDAKRYAFTAVGIAAVCSVINSSVIFSSYNVLLDLFGTEGAAVNEAYKVLYIVPLMHMGDSIQFAFQGVFSGCGQNHKGAMILLSSLWAIGFPASLLLAFVFDYGVAGVVGGLTIGLIVECPCMVWAAKRMDWQQLAEDAQAEALEDEADELELDADEEEEEEEMVNDPVPTKMSSH